ncbi:MAG TPA: hypothetical protein VF530_09950 [Planctomycetota bacterium]
MPAFRKTLAGLLALVATACVDPALRETRVGPPAPPPRVEPCPTCEHREVELWGRESLGAERVNRSWPHVHHEAETPSPR